MKILFLHKTTINFFKWICSKMTFCKSSKIYLTERPVSCIKNDCFDANIRISNKIFNFIKTVSTEQITIAITGEWGVGKSSVINFLSEEIGKNKNNVLIKFEPLLEGKLDLSDIIGLFYLQLYKNINDSSVRAVLKKCIKSVAIMSRAKITGKVDHDLHMVGIPIKAIGSIEYDLGKNIDSLIDLWDKEETKSFSEQTNDLNELLRKSKLKLYIIIDEIDRLPADYIMQYLLFCRILESFNNLVCIVGIDYDRVLYKLKNECYSGLKEYSDAQSYLDKLFQIKFNVHHNKFKIIEYCKNKLIEIDNDKVLYELLASDDYKIQNKLEKLFFYLATPRQIKKWLISIIANYEILKYLPEKLVFIQFLAVAVRHPIIVDCFSRHAFSMICELNLCLFIKDNYDISIDSFTPDDRERIIIASLGFTKYLIGKKKEYSDWDKNFSKILNIQDIDDYCAISYVREYIKSPKYLIELFLAGTSNSDQVKLYYNFFEANINSSIKTLSENEVNVDILAGDIAESLVKKSLSIKGTPDLPLVNLLWNRKIKDIDLGNPYNAIVLFSLYKHPVEKIISDSCIAMSGYFIYILFESFCVKKFSFDEFEKPSDQKLNEISIQDLKYNSVLIKNFTKVTLEEIIKEWIKIVEEDFRRCKSESFNQPKLLQAIYAYVKWSKFFGNDVRDNISNYVVDFLHNNSFNAPEKKYIKEILVRANEQYKSNISFDNTPMQDPLDELFNNNLTIKKLIFDL